MSQSKELRNHQKSKLIKRKYHLIHEIVMRGDVVVEKITSMKNLMNLSPRLYLVESLMDIVIA